MTHARILVVEDEVIVAMDIQAKLKDLGYDVPAIVASGEEAVEKAKELKPNLVMMDISLEGKIDGIEAAQEIRKSLNVPVIYLTAYSDDKTLQRAKTTMPFGYILKPFRERDLQATIEMALYRHRIEQRLLSLEKVTALGMLTTDVIHKLENPLQNINQLLKNRVLKDNTLPELVRDHLNSLHVEIEKLGHIVGDLIYFHNISEMQENHALNINDPPLEYYNGRALVIENEAHLGILSEAYLLQLGMHPLLETNSLKGWQRLQELDFELILLDMEQPGLDGKAFYERLKNHLPSYCSKLVLITGDSRTPENRYFLETNGIPYLQKPFTFQDLSQVIKNLLSPIL